jgi:hypothetical protein
MVFWVMTPCSDVVGYQYSEDGGSMFLWLYWFMKSWTLEIKLN